MIQVIVLFTFFIFILLICVLLSTQSYLELKILHEYLEMNVKTFEIHLFYCKN